MSDRSAYLVRATEADLEANKLALSSNLKREAAHAFYDGLGFERHGYSFRVMLEDAR